MSQVFMNFSCYDAFGFDLDHTLAKYVLPELFKLCHNAMADFLVNKRGYSKELLQPFELDKDFCTKGLIFDTNKGNFLKLDEEGTILRASHGTRFLDVDEIKSTYGENRHWKQYADLAETVNNIGDEYRIFENYFDMPGMVLCARMVDICDKEAGSPLEKYNIWKDILDGYNYVYNPKNFAEDKGGFFPEIKKNTAKYVTRCSPAVKAWLKSLKQGGRKLFILTSSFANFATLLLQHTLGADWQEYIDINLCFARKPGFFSKYKARPFLRLDDALELEKEPVMTIEMGNTYSQGNYKGLEKCLAKATGKEDPKILYFGDSLRSDVFPSKQYVAWDTVLVLEEMEIEGMLGYDPKDLADNVEPSAKKTKYSQEKYMGPSQEEKEFLASSKWGSFFYDDSVPCNSRMMNTFWGYLIRRYSDITIPQLDYITHFPLDHKYETFDHKDYSRQGFYPGMPTILGPKVNDTTEDVKVTPQVKDSEEHGT